MCHRCIDFFYFLFSIDINCGCCYRISFIVLYWWGMEKVLFKILHFSWENIVLFFWITKFFLWWKISRSICLTLLCVIIIIKLSYYILENVLVTWGVILFIFLGKLGCHLDRHENIGKGHIGKAGFNRIMNCPKFNHIPMILETPCADNDSYAKEVEMLYTMCNTWSQYGEPILKMCHMFSLQY